MKRIGIFGGRFDPIHIGHLIVAQDLLDRVGLEKVLFLVSHNPPHKSVEAPFQDRYRMVQLAISSNPKFEVTDIEWRLNLKKSYTVLVLKELKKDYPDSEFYFIMGYDQFIKLPTWYKVGELFKLAKLIVLQRLTEKNGDETLPYKEGVLFIRQRIVEISSTEIRERLRMGKSVKYLLPESVHEYIKRKKLYVRAEPPFFGPRSQ